MEKELIERSLAGDDEAFRVLVEAYREKIFHLCFQMVGDQEIAEDLTQETFVKAYRHLQDFREEAQFSTWLYSIARNHTLNFLKKRHPEGRLYTENVPAKEKPFELEEVIQAGLSILPEKQRQVFELFELENLSVKEIAAKLGIPSGTVRSRLHYARKRLRTHFSQ